MKTRKISIIRIILFICLLSACKLFSQNTPPIVNNVTFSERTDCSFIVDIYYDVFDEDGDLLNINLMVSSDNGVSWNFPVDTSHLSGDIGPDILPGTGKHIIWNFGVNYPDTVFPHCSIKIRADDGWLPNEGLIAYYPFNGNTNDESGNGNNGAAGGDYNYVNGLAGNSLHVISHSTGSNCDNDLGGNVLLPNFNFTNMNSFSYAIWVKDAGIVCGVAAYIYFRDNTYGIPYGGIMRTDNSIHFMAGLSSANEIIYAPYLSSYSNTFVHYCLVFNQGMTTAYINGAIVGSNMQPNNVDGVYSAIAKSWYNNNTSTRLTGTIDQVRIYNRALSQSEVQCLYHEGGW